MDKEIKEIIDAYKAGRNPPSVQKYIDEHPEEAAKANAEIREIIVAYKRGETPSSVLKQLKEKHYED